MLRLLVHCRLDSLPLSTAPVHPPAPNRFIANQAGAGGVGGGLVTAPGGPPDPIAEKKKKQQVYKQQLQQQMHAAEQARKM